ncbi:MAG TPA: protein kinase [Woeseiaceae bacterium]|nr:protein kinase [Woeseiaceae bacterium]
MDRRRWLDVKAIAADALERPPVEREAFVAARANGDAALAAEVLDLVAAAAAAEVRFETPCLATAGALAAFSGGALPDPLVGGRLGAYAVQAEIGHGGMGTAYLATRADDAYDKRVAIKLVRHGMDIESILQRFRRERQILASLEHPNIVMLLDGGTADDGRPYFVMEYVEGTPIDTYCSEKQLTLEARVRLFRAVCDAVQYAHDKHVLHRDLKPGNILVTAAGVPKLLDFGIARLFDVEAGSGATREPTLVAHAMTPRYASPEQVRGESVTPASDVYSLGVLLYELVTGHSPYPLDGRSPREVERLVCEAEPAAPTTRRGGDGDDTSLPAALPPRVARDLDTIVLAALAKDPAERYPSAAALAADLERFLARMPIGRRRPRRRRPVVHPIAAVALAAVVATAALTAWYSTRDAEPAAAAAAKPPPAKPPGLVVLPFADGGGALAYLSEGLTEDIIYRLSHLPQLRVIARDSAFRYRDATEDPARIGRDLGVRYVLTGRIAERDGDITVTAELLDADEARQLWGERYTRASADLQDLQGELARQIAASLPLARAGDPQAPVNAALAYATYTANAQAYEAYLRGRFFWNKRTPAAFNAGVAHFRQAIDRDPAFALAYLGLADTYSLLTEYHQLAAAETYPLVKDAITAALEREPTLAEAHVSLAYLRQFYEWDFAAAESEYRNALALNPGYVTGRQWYAEYLAAMGRHDEALTEIRVALAHDPLSLIVNVVEAKILYMGGHYDEALATLMEVVALDPQFPEAWEHIKRTHDRRSDYRAAIEARQTRRRILGLDAGLTPALEAAMAATDAEAYWRARLDQEFAESRTEGFLPFEFAELYAQAGETAAALEWLTKACRANDFMMVYANVMPNLAPLREEPGFRQLVGKGCAVSGRTT